jgi:quinol---cytochrome-c reductase cytochrome c subunit
MSTRRRVAWFLGLVVLFLVPAGLFAMAPGREADATTLQIRRFAVASQSQLIDAGTTLFQEHCSTCHGPSGQGTTLGPSILGLGAADYDFQMSTGRMPLAQPGAQAIRKPPLLTRSHIVAIIAYLTSLNPGGTQIPIVHVAAGDVSQGQSLYQLNCAPCHSFGGTGGAVGPQVAPNLRVATAKEIAEAVRVGPGTMPRFDTNAFTDDQLDSLIAYVLYLRDGADVGRGGATLGLFGPVIEGFVALLMGLGAAVLVTRFIGERA